MAIAISAAVSTSTNPGVDLTVTGLTVTAGFTLTITRAWAGQTGKVRGASSAIVTGATMVVTDYESPIDGTSTTWTITEYNASGAIVGTASSSALTVSLASVWISDPLAPGAACPIALHANALEQVDYSRDGGPSAVIGAASPVALVGQRHIASGIDVDIKCPGLADATNALAVLNTADPVCIRVPAGAAYAVLPSVAYISAATVSRSSRTMKYGGTMSVIRWSGDLVRAPAVPVVAPSRTYADLAAASATYSGLPTLYTDYLAALRG